MNKLLKNWLQLAYKDRQRRCSYFQEMLDNSLWWHYITLSWERWGGVEVFLIHKEKDFPINWLEAFSNIEQQSKNSCQWCCKAISFKKQHRADGNHYCLFCYLKHEFKNFLSKFEDKILDLKLYLAEKIQDMKRWLFWIYCDVKNYFTRKFYILKNKLHEN